MDTITKHSDNYEEFGIYKLFKFVNVYKYEDIQYKSYNVFYEPSLQIHDNEHPNDYYLVLDTQGSHALFHWVAECMIFLPLYIELKKQYPTLKIIFKEKAEYHSIILEYYNILSSDILYQIENNNNVCFFPLPITALLNSDFDDDYILYANVFIDWLNNIHFDKTINHLIMPRQILQNSIANPRTHNCEDIISNMPNATVFHTDQLKTFYDQHRLVKSSKIIMVTDGSAFVFNGLLAKDSTILVLGDIICEQGRNSKKMQFYIDKITSQNNVIFIPYYHGDFHNCTFLYDDVKNYV